MYGSTIRLQMAGGKEKYLNMSNALTQIIKEEGVMALYKGSTVCVCMYVCYVCLTFSFAYAKCVSVILYAVCTVYYIHGHILCMYVCMTICIMYARLIGAVPRMVVIGPLFAITLLSFEAQKSYMIKNGLL